MWKVSTSRKISIPSFLVTSYSPSTTNKVETFRYVTQCAPVTIHSRFINVPPQYIRVVFLTIRPACQGHSPGNARWPPTMRLVVRRPHLQGGFNAATVIKNMWIKYIKDGFPRLTYGISWLCYTLRLIRIIRQILTTFFLYMYIERLLCKFTDRSYSRENLFSHRFFHFAVFVKILNIYYEPR